MRLFRQTDEERRFDYRQGRREDRIRLLLLASALLAAAWGIASPASFGYQLSAENTENSLRVFRGMPYLWLYLGTGLLSFLGFLVQFVRTVYYDWWEWLPLQHWALMGFLAPTAIHLFAVLAAGNHIRFADVAALIAQSAVLAGWSIALFLLCALAILSPGLVKRRRR